MKQYFLILAIMQWSLLSNIFAQEVGTLVITSTPENSEVYLNGERTGLSTPFKKDVAVGVYAVEIRFKIFQSFKDSVVVTANNVTQLNENLKDDFGAFMITSTPSAAKVYLGNEYLGNTPLERKEITPGEYTLTLEKEHYNRTNIDVRIEKDEIFESYTELRAGYGTISILANPEADIYIDRKFQSNRIYNGRLGAGTHVVEVKKDGYKSDTRIVLIKKGEEYQELFVLDPMLGSIDVKSTPLAAMVYLDDELKGKSPLRIEGLSIGKHVIKIVKEGYVSSINDVTVSEDETMYIEQSLLKGIKITTDPSSANIYLDGNFVGVSPHVLMNLGAGKYQIKMEKEGYADITKDLIVDPNKAGSNIHEKLIDGFIFTTEPSGALVYMDGEFVGTTPKIFSNLTDTHEIVLKKEGYAWVERQQIFNDQQLRNIHERLSPGCLVTIACSVPGGDIFVDDKLMGQSEVKIPLSLAKHTIKIANNKYFSDLETELIVEENGQKISYDLLPKTCKTSFKSVPDGALIYLNDKSILKTNGATLQDAGSYTLRLERDNYQSIIDTLDVFKAEESFTYTLLPTKFRSKPLALLFTAIWPGSGRAYLTRGEASSFSGFLFYGLAGGAYYTYKESETYGDKLLTETDRDRIEDLKNKQDDYKLYSNVMLGTAAGIWVINMISTLATPSEKNRFKKMELTTRYDPMIQNFQLGLCYKF